MEMKLKEIDELICNVFGVTDAELHLRTRKREIVEARQMAIYVRAKYLDIPPRVCGDHFGLDRTTCIHAINNIINLMGNNKYFRSRANEVLNEIEK